MYGLKAVKRPDPELPSFIRNWNQFYGIVAVAGFFNYYILAHYPVL